MANNAGGCKRPQNWKYAAHGNESGVRGAIITDTGHRVACINNSYKDSHAHILGYWNMHWQFDLFATSPTNTRPPLKSMGNTAQKPSNEEEVVHCRY